jgi:hypothetical protein
MKVFLPLAGIVLAPLNARARENAMNALKQFAGARDFEKASPFDEEQAVLVADLIMDALNHDQSLRTEITEWLASKYVTECQAALADIDLGIA